MEDEAWLDYECDEPDMPTVGDYMNSCMSDMISVCEADEDGPIITKTNDNVDLSVAANTVQASEEKSKSQPEGRQLAIWVSLPDLRGPKMKAPH